MAARTFQTVADHIRDNAAIAAHCYERGCGHFAWLDLDALAETLGPDHSCMHNALTPKLRCSACGSRNVGIRLHPDTRPKS